MVTDNKKWHYLAVKSISGLLRRRISNYNGDFYCLNCFHSYTTNNKLKKHQRICDAHDFCRIAMLNNDNKVLKYVPGKKSLEHPFIIYTDVKFILRILDTRQNNPEKSYTENKALHVPSGYELVLCCSFDNSKTEIMCYRGNDCIEKFCKQLRDLATKIINYEKMEIILTDEEKRSYEQQEVCHIYREKFCYYEDDEKTYKNVI